MFDDNFYYYMKCFTNIEKLKYAIENMNLEPVDEYSKADILIVDSNFDFEQISEDIERKIKISVDKLDSNVDAFISSEHIELYLDWICKCVSGDYGPDLDFEGIRDVTKGTLVQHIKVNLNPFDYDDMDWEFEGLDQKLNLKENFDSAMVFISSISKVSIFRLANCMRAFSELESFDKTIMAFFMPNTSEIPEEAIDPAKNYVEFVELIAFKR